MIDEEIQKFKADTGYTPCSVSVSFIRTQEMGKALPDHHLQGVKTEYDLGFGR